MAQALVPQLSQRQLLQQAKSKHATGRVPSDADLGTVICSCDDFLVAEDSFVELPRVPLVWSQRVLKAENGRILITLREQYALESERKFEVELGRKNSIAPACIANASVSSGAP